MDSKVFKFRLFPEKEQDGYVIGYIERNGRINSEEIGELLYKGIVSLSEPQSVEEDTDKLSDKVNRIETALQELSERIVELRDQLMTKGQIPLFYNKVVKLKQKRKGLFGKRDKSPVDVYVAQSKRIDGYKGLADYMVKKNPSADVWRAVRVAGEKGLTDSEIVTMVENNGKSEKMYELMGIILTEKGEKS